MSDFDDDGDAVYGMGWRSVFCVSCRAFRGAGQRHTRARGVVRFVVVVVVGAVVLTGGRVLSLLPMAVLLLEGVATVAVVVCCGGGGTMQSTWTFFVSCFV